MSCWRSRLKAVVVDLLLVLPLPISRRLALLIQFVWRGFRSA